MSCAHHDPFSNELGPYSTYLKDSLIGGNYGKQPRDKSCNSVSRPKAIKTKTSNKCAKEVSYLNMCAEK